MLTCIPSILIFSIPTWLICSHLSVLSLSDAYTVTLFPCMAIISMNATSSLNDHYGCSSSCMSAFIDGQPQSTSSANVLRCSIYRITSLISLPVMHSIISLYTSIVLMLMCMLVISSSLPVAWLCLNSQSSINNSGTGLYNILTLYQCIHISIV